MIPAAVSNMVNSVGESVTYQSITGSYNAATGENSITTTDYAVKARVKNYSSKGSNPDIQSGDRKAILAGYGLAFTPKKGDRLQSNGQWYSVISVNRLAVGDDDALYILQVRE